MHGDGGIDQIASQRSEAGKCPLLVGPGKLAESDHIRRKKAASFRVSAMAVPSPHARLARLCNSLDRLLLPDDRRSQRANQGAIMDVGGWLRSLGLEKVRDRISARKR